MYPLRSVGGRVILDPRGRRESAPTRQRERTMQTTYLSAAETAKLIRKALKSNFPGVKFSVRSDTYAGGASIRVRHTDGPTKAEVEAVVGMYQGSDFDGMQDLKTSREAVLLAGEGGALRSVRFGADFVFVDRDYTPATYLAAAERQAKRFGFTVPTEADLYIYEAHATGLRNDPPLAHFTHRTRGQEIRAELERLA